jgi:hypothetical protein
MIYQCKATLQAFKCHFKIMSSQRLRNETNPWSFLRSWQSYSYWRNRPSFTKTDSALAFWQPTTEPCSRQSESNSHTHNKFSNLSPSHLCPDLLHLFPSFQFFPNRRLYAFLIFPTRATVLWMPPSWYNRRNIWWRVVINYLSTWLIN